MKLISKGPTICLLRERGGGGGGGKGDFRKNISCRLISREKILKENQNRGEKFLD